MRDVDERRFRAERQHPRHHVDVVGVGRDAEGDAAPLLHQHADRGRVRGPVAVHVGDAVAAEDLALVMNAISGQDPLDATSAPLPVPDYTKSLRKDVAGLRLGLPKEFYTNALNDAMRASIVNDGLMTIFFLLIGLEIKRELAVGELSDRRGASLPIAAAIGGMVIGGVVGSAMSQPYYGPGYGYGYAPQPYYGGYGYGYRHHHHHYDYDD